MSYDPNNRANFDNTNSGVIFPNEKRQNDKSPTGKGSAEVACPHCGVVQKYWVSSWVKKSKAGKPFNSLAFTADQPQVNNTPAPKADGDFDDDIPF